MQDLLTLPTAASASPEQTSTDPAPFWALYINVGDRTNVDAWRINWVAEPGEDPQLWVAYSPSSGITRKALDRIVARWYGTPAGIVEVSL